MSIMIKVRDGLDGRINLDETFSKPIDYDTWWRLNKGAVLAEEILLLLKIQKIKPAMQMRYDRLAFEGPDDVRITPAASARSRRPVRETTP